MLPEQKLWKTSFEGWPLSPADIGKQGTLLGEPDPNLL